MMTTLGKQAAHTGRMSVMPNHRKHSHCAQAIQISKPRSCDEFSMRKSGHIDVTITLRMPHFSTGSTREAKRNPDHNPGVRYAPPGLKISASF